MRRSSEYAEFTARRAKTVYFQFREDQAGTNAAKDCSASNVAAKFRAWTVPPGAAAAYLVNLALTKTTNPNGSDGAVTAGSTGWFKGAVEFAADYGQVRCEAVLLDTAVARASGTIITPSGYFEEQWEGEWEAVVRPSVTAT